MVGARKKKGLSLSVGLLPGKTRETRRGHARLACKRVNP
jgi:hypothetical protein